MSKTKAPKRDRQAKYLQNDEVSYQKAANGLAKNILLLVEGETEAAYFNKLKQNSLLNGG